MPLPPGYVRRLVASCYWLCTHLLFFRAKSCFSNGLVLIFFPFARQRACEAKAGASPLDSRAFAIQDRGTP